MAEVLVLQHVDCEPLGTIEDALRGADLGFRYVQGYTGEAVPQQIGDAPGLIVMGGPMGVYERDRYPWLGDEMRLIAQAVAQGVPTLGVCLGSQLLAAALGANVRPGPQKEIGWYPVTRTEPGAADPLWSLLPERFVGFLWHGDVFDVPLGAVSLASSELTAYQAFRFGPSAYGVLPHMEVTEEIVRDWTAAFAGELEDASLDPAVILDGVSAHLPALREAGRAFFGAWAALAQTYGSGSR